MKKIIPIMAIAVLLSVFNLSAQMRWGLTAGINMANADVSQGGNSVSTSNLTSFQAGLIGVKSISEKMNFQTGALISGKGAKSTDDGGVEVNPIYVEIPLNFQFVLESGTMKILPYGGFYIGIGVMGKYKAGTFEEDIKFGDSEEDNMKRMDYGFCFGAALDFGNNIGAFGQYQIGLANLSTNTGADYKLTNFSLGLFYMFGQ
jgi:hypothetical protein